MGMTYPYCNITTDLQYVYKDIENFEGKETVTDFTNTSGNVYQLEDTGYVSKVWEDEVALTAKTSIVTVEATAGTFWYDETNDILYIHSSDSTDPDTHTIKIGENWKILKTFMSERAFQQLEALLDPKYPRPLPFAFDQYNSKNYDSDIIECAALLTCINIIKHKDPGHPDIKILQDRVWNVAEEIGILWEYKKGLRSFSFECTADQFDGNIYPVSLDAASTGKIWVVGTGDRSGRYNINIVIVDAGAVGTATFKYSLDNKTTYSSNILTANQYVPILSDIYLKFNGTFVADDEWLLIIAGDPEKLTHQGITGIKLRRY